MNNESGGALLGVEGDGAPGLALENELALAAWSFCGGWNPALIPAAAAFYGIADVELLTVQLLAVRDAIAAHREAVSSHEEIVSRIRGPRA